MYSLLNKKDHNKIINKFHNTYSKYLIQLIKVAKDQASQNGNASTFVSLMKDSKLKEYKPVHLYWLKFVEKSFYIQNLIEAWNNNPDDQSEIESEIFTFWNDSEFALDFSKLLKRKTLINSSLDTYLLYCQQVVAFYYIHIKGSYSGKLVLNYKPIPEMGEQIKLFTSGLKKSSLEIKKIQKNFLHLKDDLQLIYPSWLVNIKIDSKKIPLSIVPGSLNIKRNLPKLQASIENALNIISHTRPEIVDIFGQYSHTLVLVDAPGIVSYSSQDLPGYSTINIVDRDSIDLMDDLLHENGHHILNRILDTTNLIDEDEFKIFYSPWRKSLRPIRGIYHAYLTFFWAFTLFIELSRKIDYLKNNEIATFTNKQIAKIYFRAIEEFEMLKYSYHDIQVAYKLGKVSKAGLELVKKTQKNLTEQSHYIKKISLQLSKLDLRQFNKILKLQQELRNNRTHYKIKL